MKILLLDNYDSFTYNLAHALRELISGNDSLDVFRNDKIGLEQAGLYDKILLSPGPGIPSEAGILERLVERYAPEKSILGVCLGEQAIGEVFGAGLENLAECVHGVATPIIKKGSDPLFDSLPDRFDAGRYHSWVVSKDSFPDCLKITAEDENGFIMAISHRKFDVRGVQFHPESVLTPHGKQILANWLKM